MSTFPSISVDMAGRIIDKFGGESKLVELSGKTLGYNTVKAWRTSGVIPEKYRYGLLVIARENLIDLTPFDFVAYLADLPQAA